MKVGKLTESLKEMENRPTNVVSAPEKKEGGQPKNDEEIKKLKEKLTNVEK